MARKKNNSFTFVLIRDTERPVRELKLAAWQLRALLIAGGGLLIGTAVLAILGLLGMEDAFYLQALSEENDRLEQEIGVVSGKVGALESTLRDVDEFQRWARNLAKLDPIETSALAGAAGGPEPLQMATVAAGIDRRIDRLGAKAQVLRRSAEEVLEAIRDDQERLSRLPSIRPIMGGRTSSRYGRRVDPFTGRPAFHGGLDLSARRGTPIMATADGRVKTVERKKGGYGNLLIIDHGNGYETRYAHCDRLLVQKGQKVARGELIATVGSSGHSTAPHLHYEIAKDGKSINPTQFILSDEFIVD